MKKHTLFCASLLAVAAMPMVGYAQIITSSIYDHSAWRDEGILTLFSEAWDAGRNYPTTEAFNAAGMNYIDMEMARSHTRLRDIAKDALRDIRSDINHDRLLWTNFPAGYGRGIGGYPSSTFDQDVFSMWNYTNLFGSWNYSLFEAPGSWVDAAHKNGTRIYGGIKFFECWVTSYDENFFEFINSKNDDGTYKYSRAFVNAATFFGNDGYNYNQEGSTYQTSDWYNFHAEVMKHARELNLTGFGIGQYTENASLSASNAHYLYGTSEGKTYDCFLNYSGNKIAYQNVSNSLIAAKNSVGNYDGLYQGCLIVGMSTDYWMEMNEPSTKGMNICLWGEHDQNRFFQFRVGDDPISTQENYQLLLEKGFSGANRNPLNCPEINNEWGAFKVESADLADKQLNNAPGFCSMVPERTAINFALPFETHFSLGNGENYFYKGKVSHGSWYNMSQQDIVPTYRWLVTKKGDMKVASSDLDVRFSHEDAYMAGSSLKITGATTAGADVVLYRTALQVTEGNPMVTLAVKGAQGETNLSVIIKKQGSSEWIEVPFGALAGKTWEEKTLAIAGLAKGDVIENIGLRVNSAKEGFKTYVGKLRISDDRNVTHAAIREGSLIAEVCQEYTTQLSLRLGWQPNYDGYDTSINDFGMVFNDEINVDHFEIFYKEGQDGAIKEVGRTAQWATFIGNLPCAQNTDAYIGVRSVSVDLKHNSPIEWVRVPHSEGTLNELSEEDPYGKSWMSVTGVNIKIEDVVNQVYVEKVTTEGATQNLNYTASSNPCTQEDDQYYFAKNHKLVLTQGEKVKLFYKGFNAPSGVSLKNNIINAYIDYDGNYSFLDADEVLGTFGKLKSTTEAIVNPGVTLVFTVPVDAHIGSSRLRIVASDAWNSHPGATGSTVGGYSIDFPVEIVGTNPDRGSDKTYKDRRDEGEPEQPEHTDGNVFTGIESVDAATDYATVIVVDGVAYFTNTEKAWFYDATGRFVKYVDGAESVNVSDLNGVYVVKLLNKQVIRSAKVVVK